MLGGFLADFPDGPSSVLRITPLAAATPSPTPSTVSSDFSSALPSWLLVALLGVVTLVIVGGFGLTAYSLSAPRSTLKNIIGKKGLVSAGVGPAPDYTVTPQLIKKLATSARSGRRTTRTTLAIVGFSLLGVVIIAIFGLSGQGVRDLRNQVIAAVTTLVATIAGFYFGAETARTAGSQAGSAGSAPGLGPDPKNPGFVVGFPGSYRPTLSGTPAPTVILSQGTLPDDLTLDHATGVMSGKPADGTAGTYPIILTASNGVNPDATLQMTLRVDHPAAPGLAQDPTNPKFTVGQAGTYTPVLTGAPAPTVSLSQGPLPTGMGLDTTTGVISGKPTAPGPYTFTLTAKNGVSPDATLTVTGTVAG